MSEVKRYEFNGLAVEPRVENGGPVFSFEEAARLCSFANEKQAKQLFTRNRDEFTSDEVMSFVSKVVRGRAYNADFLTPLGLHHFAMICKTEVGPKLRAWVVETFLRPYLSGARMVTPEQFAALVAERDALKSEAERTHEVLRILGNKDHDIGRAIGCIDKIGTILASAFNQIKRERADERTAKLIDDAGGDLFTGKGDLTQDDHAVLATLATSGPYPSVRDLAKAAKLTQRATTLSLAELSKRGLVRREKGLIDLAPRGPRLLGGESEVAS